jgi:hypothetical protein
MRIGSFLPSFSESDNAFTLRFGHSVIQQVKSISLLMPIKTHFSPLFIVPYVQNGHTQPTRDCTELSTVVELVQQLIYNAGNNMECFRKWFQYKECVYNLLLFVKTANIQNCVALQFVCPLSQKLSRNKC